MMLGMSTALVQPRSASGGAVVEPSPVPLSNGLTGVGHSLLSPNEVPAGEKGIMKRGESHNNANPPDLLLAGCIETKVSAAAADFVNAASGGSTPAQVATAYTALSAGNKGRPVIVMGNRNEVPNETTITDAAAYALTHMATIMGARLHDNFMIVGCTGGEFRLTERWGRRQLINKAFWRTYSSYVFDAHRHLVQKGGTGAGDDLTCTQLDVVPFSYRDGVDTAVAPTTGDAVHWAEAGNQPVADDVVSEWLIATEGYSPYFTPYEEQFLTGAAAVTAQTNGGAIHTPSKWWGTGTWSLPAQTHSAHFAIDGTTGAITRASATVLTAGFYDITRKLTNAYGEYEGVVRVFFGKHNTAPKTKTLDGTGGIAVLTRTLGLGTSGTGGIAFRVTPTTSGAARLLVGPTNTRWFIQLLATNRWNIQARNSGGTVILNVQTSSTTTHTTNVGAWVWLDWDVASAGPTVSCGIELDGSAVDYGATVTTLTGSQAVDWTQNNLMQLFHGTPLTIPGISTPLAGSVDQFLVFKAGRPDFTNSAVLDAVRDPTTRAALDLGGTPTVGGVAPSLNIGELSAGDLCYGNLGGDYGLFGAPYIPGAGTITG